MNQTPRLWRSLSIIGSGTMLSRLLGFLRDLLTAAWLGAGPVADAFIIAQRLPNLCRSLLAEGGIQAVFAPTYNKLLINNQNEAARFAALIWGWWLALLLPLVITAVVFMPQLISILAPGLDVGDSTKNLAVTYTAITIGYVLLIAYNAIQGAVLNAHHRFGAYAAAPALLNLVLIGAMFCAHLLGADIGYAAALALLGGGLVQTLYLEYDLQRNNLHLGFLWPRWNNQVKHFFVRLGPGLLAIGALNINLLVGTFFASWLPSGSIAALYYADRLSQLPLALIGAALATALLPALTKARQQQDVNAGTDTAPATLQRGLITGLLLALPATALLVVLAEPIVRLLFQHGSFTADDTILTAKALALYALMLPAAVASRLLQTYCFAAEDTKTPAKAAIGAVIFHALAAWYFTNQFGLAGIAAALTVAVYFNLILQVLLLNRIGQWPQMPKLTKQIIIIGCAALLAAIITKTVNVFLVFGDGWIQTAITTTIAALSGGAAYTVIALLFRQKLFHKSKGKNVAIAQPKLLLVCSAGGHLLQMHGLLHHLFHDYKRHWVCLNKADAVSLLRGESVAWAHGPTNRNIPNLIRNFWLCWRVLRHEKPSIIISTGAGLAIPFFVAGRILGIRTVYLESFARQHNLSLTGKGMYYSRVATNMLVQSERLAQLYPRALFKGTTY